MTSEPLPFDAPEPVDPPMPSLVEVLLSLDLESMDRCFSQSSDMALATWELRCPDGSEPSEEALRVLYRAADIVGLRDLWTQAWEVHADREWTERRAAIADGHVLAPE